MAYYLIIFNMLIWIFVCTYGCYKEKISNVQCKTLFLFANFLILALCAGLRNISVGSDTHSYAKHYIVICHSSLKDILSNFKFYGMEIGYNLLCKLISYISPNYYFFQIIVCFLFCFGMMRFIKKNAINPLLSVSVFLGSGMYLYSFNILRQMLAVMLVANAWEYLKSKKYFRYISIVLIATTFHITALSFFVSFIIYSLWKYRKLRKYIVLGILFTGLEYERILIFLTPILKRFYNYGNYLVNDRAKQTAGFVTIFWIIILVMALIELLYKNEQGSSKNLYSVFSIITVVCNFIGLHFNYVDRIGFFFMPFWILLFDNFYFIIATKIIKTIYLCGTITCMLIYFIISSGTTQHIYSLCF